MYNMDDIRERVILVGVDTEGGETAERSLDELAELAATAGAEVTGRLIQTRECVHPATYIGRGKLIELKELLWETEATGIICDDELSSTQLGNLEEELDCKVLDRTLLILDIFAARAVSGEGKIQVELAQLRYRASRLSGLGRSLSRLGGGIGTRGPGEKAGNGSPSYPGADQSSEKRTGRCGAAQRIAPQSAESVRNESGSTGRIYVSRKKQY